MGASDKRIESKNFLNAVVDFIYFSKVSSHYNAYIGTSNSSLDFVTRVRIIHLRTNET